MNRILVVDDEQDMQFILSDNLENEGYRVAATASGREGVRLALSGEFDLVLLDVMLPDLNGIEACKLIRAQNARIPIIMLTAKGDEVDRVVGLEVGADDYVAKPFGMRELVARVKAALRRSGSLHPETVARCEIGTRTVDFSRNEVIGPAGKESLTRHECELLQFLAAHRGQTVPRKHILESVWGVTEEAGNRTVDIYVGRLRAKIEDAPSSPRHLITVHGSGYRLV